MAIKFSEFNVGATTSDIDYLVGYKNTDNVQIPVGLVGTNTTYTVSTAQAGANETITLTGSDSSTDLITITAGNDISLTDDGAGNGFTIASTVVGDTYTIGTSTNGSSVDVNLDAAAGADSNITLTPATGISISQAADVVTITNTEPNATHTGDVTGSAALTIANDVVSYEKVDNEFKTSDALTAAATVDVNFDTAQIFTLTPTSSTTLNITNPKIGITKAIIVTGAGGSYTLSFTVGGAAGTFNKIAGDYDDTSSTKNFIQIICVSATEFWYSISQIS
jgi:hypothetical protein